MRAADKIFYCLISYIVVCILLQPESKTASRTGSDTSSSTRITDATSVTTTEHSSTSSPAANESWWSGKSWWFGWEGNPCCGDLMERENAGIRMSDGNLPASCYVEGATCALYGLYDPAPAPSAALGGSISGGEATACLDSDGRARTGAAENAGHMDSPGIGLPVCAEGSPRPTGPGWFWWVCVTTFRLFVASTIFTFVHTPGLPLKLGDEGHRMFETMTYARRLLAVMTLWAVSGGAPLLFLSLEGFLLHGAWVFHESCEGIFFFVAFMVVTCGTMRPLPYMFPRRDVIDHKLFELWRDFFDFSFVSEFDGPLALLLGASVLDDLLPGVWPVSGVVATALVRTPVLRHLINYLGARKASTKMIHQMFADGYEGVGVVTGGIAEMFVSSETEKLACIRKNFGRAALTGGHSIVPIFCFGVSRTLGVVPGFNNCVVRAISRKLHVPIMFYWGAFGLVPHRQQLKMVVGRPIKAQKAVGEVADKEAQALCGKVQDTVVELYNRHKPFWETRPIEYVS